MRSRSAQALTDGIQRRYGPGVTVWGKGDAAHQESTSDHNEDDTPGSKSEQSDADNIPEHRAIDVARLWPMSMERLRDLRVRLTDRPANQRRLRYVILERSIWRARNGWRRDDYSGEFHGHLHVSVAAADDDNAAPYDLDDREARDVLEDSEPGRNLHDRDYAQYTGKPYGAATKVPDTTARLERVEAKLDAILAKLEAPR